MKIKIKNFFTSIFELILPRICNGCEEVLEIEEKIICFKCKLDLPFVEQSFIKDQIEKKINISFTYAFALLYFEKKNLSQKLIHRLKYKGIIEIGTLFGNLLSQIIKKSSGFTNCDVILPVPLHKKRLKKRGYNQVTTFGKALSKNLEIPFREDILIRKIYKKSQTLKKKEKRLKEIKNAFSCNANIKEFSHILLLDDVLTTGATLESCAKTILKEKKLKISVAVIAYAI